jgi:hypothetical protein
MAFSHFTSDRVIVARPSRGPMIFPDVRLNESRPREGDDTMSKKRFSGWAILALIVGSSVTAHANAGPLLDILSPPPCKCYYSPLHYWVPGIYRLQAYLQPNLQEFAPTEYVPSHSLRLRGDRSNSIVPNEVVPSSSEASPMPPRN